MGAKQTKVVDPNSETFTRNVSALCSNQNETPRMTGHLRKNFVGGLSYNLTDPRSPSLFLNRTPLVVEESNEKTLNLNDTFSDLFVGNNSAASLTFLPKHCNEMDVADGNKDLDVKVKVKAPLMTSSACDGSSLEFTSLCEEETMALPQCPPNLKQQLIDPRSPCMLPRTPIVFDEETQQEAVLENILLTLSLGLSSASINPSNPKLCDSKKPTNRHLDSLRALKKPEKPKRKSIKLVQKQHIYLDNENTFTPKRKAAILNGPKNRTPLSCLKNRTHFRSRSVESKSSKPRVTLTSFDDNLNSAQEYV